MNHRNGKVLCVVAHRERTYNRASQMF